ncbi:MAG: DUF2079 domain-containing protein [Ardenticatenaceae bacterium]
MMIALYILFQGRVALRLHEAFVTSANDLSNIDQVVWNSQNGRILERTSGARSVPRYGEHLEPIWIGFGLIYLFWDSVKALLLAQTVALAAGALPVFWLARDAWRLRKVGAPSGQPASRGIAPTTARDCPERPSGDYAAGLVFAAMYLLSPFIGRANSAEVHAMPFAVAPMLLAIYWGWQGRWGRVAPLVLWLLLVREDAGLLLIAFGLWTWLVLRGWKAGMALVASGLTGVAITVFGIIAYFAEARFSGREQSIFFERYEIFGEGAVGIVWGMLTRPDLWLELIREPERLAFLQDFVISTGGLMLLSPTSWLLFAPHFVLNFLSDYFAQYGNLQHYGTPLVPGLMVAAILGGAQALRWAGGHPIIRLLLLGLTLSGALWSARTAEWQPLARSWIQPPVTAHHRLLPEIIALIPPRAPLSADPQLHPHLAHRPDAYRFPKVGKNAQWVLVDVTTNTTQHPADLQRKLLALLEEDWGIATAQDGYLLLQRGATNKHLPDSFYTFGQPEYSPQVPYHLRFGEQLELLGYDIKQDFWGRVRIGWHLQRISGTECPDECPLPKSLTIDAALLSPEGAPLPDTAYQPLTLLLWQPLAKWQVGQKHVVQTLPRPSKGPFWPALTVRNEAEDEAEDKAEDKAKDKDKAEDEHQDEDQNQDNPLPIIECTKQDPLCEPQTARNRDRLPLQVTQKGPWLTAGEWQLQHHHAQRGKIGWRQWQAPAPLAAQPGEWAVARLGGWHVALAGQEIQVTLQWQATQEHAPPTQRFLHLVPAQGAPVPIAQQDGALGGDYPITQWAAGEWVSEVITISLPPDAPNEWRLLVGLYDPNNGQRLPVAPTGQNATFELK